MVVPDYWGVLLMAIECVFIVLSVLLVNAESQTAWQMWNYLRIPKWNVHYYGYGMIAITVLLAIAIIWMLFRGKFITSHSKNMSP
jgi:uncharacterized membrane protein YukC